MINSAVLKSKLAAGEYAELLSRLYGDASAERVIAAVESFEHIYGERDVAVFSAPGRTEVGGNHTDHQHGAVLAAAVNMDVLAVAAVNGDMCADIHSEGFAPDRTDLTDLAVNPNENGTSAALVRGIAARMTELGSTVCGFDAYMTSLVPKGSGLSSSAAFEVLVGTMFNEFAHCGFSPIEIAQIGQYAENVYFGKPCGLMDQASSAVGGFASIDFADPSAPVVRSVDCDLAANGYALCIVDAGGSHAELTPEYAAVPAEMKSVAALMGVDVLGDVSREDFYAQLPGMRGKVSDRAIMRAMHFFAETERAKAEADALMRGDIDAFLELVRASGYSSQTMLQNTFPCCLPEERSVCLALALSQDMLSEWGGAWRVHGGGFAGTIQAFVPVAHLDEYVRRMESAFGEGKCHVLRIRADGAERII